MLLFFLIAFISWLLQLFLPWWIMPVTAFVTSSLLAKSTAHAFWSGSLGGGLTWLIPALITSFAQGTLMTERMATLFSLPGSWLLYPVTFLIAGLTGGLAALSGYYLKSLRTTAG